MKIKLSSEILNNGLNFSMEFGENWLVEINNRLSKKHPELSKSELDNCEKICRKINKISHDYVSKNPVKEGNEILFIESSKFKNFIKNKYDWITDDNLNNLYSQSCYYALR
ncbi:hypothetical protein [Flavobacterium sp.]|uniref:hypothetical protein n=1 Tax=Flavobacterium sp. TaxID=239 RepID=UPI003C4188E5